MVSQSDLKLFLDAEIILMQKAYAKERPKNKEEFFMNWINRNSSNFRKFWDKSLCKSCSNECTYKTLIICKRFNHRKSD